MEECERINTKMNLKLYVVNHKSGKIQAKDKRLQFFGGKHWIEEKQHMPHNYNIFCGLVLLLVKKDF